MRFHQLFIGGRGPRVNGFIRGQWEKEHLEMIYVMLQLLPCIELPWCSTSKTQIAFQPSIVFKSVFSTNVGTSTGFATVQWAYLSASVFIVSRVLPLLLLRLWDTLHIRHHITTCRVNVLKLYKSSGNSVYSITSKGFSSSSSKHMKYVCIVSPCDHNTQFSSLYRLVWYTSLDSLPLEKEGCFEINCVLTLLIQS